MAGNMTFEALKAAVKDGTIDTVLTCFPDMQGRLMGKRFHAVNFGDQLGQRVRRLYYGPGSYHNPHITVAGRDGNGPL